MPKVISAPAILLGDWGEAVGAADDWAPVFSASLNSSGSVGLTVADASTISDLMENFGCSGGKQTLSSQAWNFTLPEISTGPGFASAGTSMGMKTTILPV